MTAAIISICAVFGLIVGSFLNVLIYRVPRGLSIVAPPSACPHCESPIKPYDNIPVLSWLVLRGRCRSCRGSISARYPLVELTTMALFAGAAVRLGRSWTLPAYCVLLAGMLALAIIDVEHFKLPKRLVWMHLALVALLFTVAAAVLGQWRALFVGVACALGWSSIFFLINFFSPRMMGFGDVRFALVLGLGLGWLSVGHAVLGFFLANFIGLIMSIALILTKRMSKDQPLPYGVYLAAGTAVAFYFGAPLLRPFHLS